MRKNGFTLVEVLIIVAILGILWAVVAPQFELAREGARRGNEQTTIAVQESGQVFLDNIPNFVKEDEELVEIRPILKHSEQKWMIVGYEVTTRRK